MPDGFANRFQLFLSTAVILLSIHGVSIDRPSLGTRKGGGQENAFTG